MCCSTSTWWEFAITALKSSSSVSCTRCDTEGSRALYRLSLTPRRRNASSSCLSAEVAKPHQAGWGALCIIMRLVMLIKRICYVMLWKTLLSGVRGRVLKGRYLTPCRHCVERYETKVGHEIKAYRPTLCSENKHPLFFSCTTLWKSNQFEWNFQKKIAMKWWF